MNIFNNFKSEDRDEALIFIHSLSKTFNKELPISFYIMINNSLIKEIIFEIINIIFRPD